MNKDQFVQVDGRSIKLSNLDKVLWPQLGLTKADLLDYHATVYKVTKDHWKDRALTVTRYPHGVEDDFFYQKNRPSSAPAWVVSRRVGRTEYVSANDLSTITWLGNSGAIEFHPSTYLMTNLQTPSYAIIDLDPTLPQGFSEAVQVAKYCRDFLDSLGLKGYPKLSGATGVHIYVPLQPNYSFKITAELVRFIGVSLRRRHSQRVTLERLIKNRRGVYIDYLQNHPEKTIIGAYSPRATPNATVSTPVSWDDLDYFKPSDFTIKTVPGWIKERGDLFSRVLSHPQSLNNVFLPSSDS